MSRLRIFDHDAPAAPLLTATDHAAIAAELQKIGVAFADIERAGERAAHPERLVAHAADLLRRMLLFAFFFLFALA